MYNLIKLQKHDAFYQSREGVRYSRNIDIDIYDILVNAIWSMQTMF